MCDISVVSETDAIISSSNGCISNTMRIYSSDSEEFLGFPKTQNDSEKDMIRSAKRYAAKFVAEWLKLDTSNCIKHLDAQVVKGGTTNVLIRVWNRHYHNACCLVRFYGRNTSEWINRDRESAILSLLSHENMGKQVLAYFDGGAIESWIAGRPLTPPELGFAAQQIAITLGRLHSVSLNEKDPVVSRIARFHKNGQVQSDLWEAIYKLMHICKGEREKILKNRTPLNARDASRRRCLLLFDLSTVEQVLADLRATISNLSSPIVLCHADLLAGNILKLPDGTMRFIDFEYAAPMERGFDIANHFLEYAGFECKWSKCPTEQEQRLFLRYYDEALNSQSDKDKSDGREQRVEELLREIKPFFAVSHILWGLWALVQSVNSEVDFDFPQYAFGRLLEAMSYSSSKP